VSGRRPAALRGLRARLARRGRLLRRRVTGDAGAFTLLYHRVADVVRDPWGLVVSPERFAEQLAVLRRHAHPMGFAELARARAAGKLPRNAVAVTFDDGYADNLHYARPLLAAHDVPATVFLATGSAGRGLPFWWDEVERLILGPHSLPGSLHLDGSAVGFHRAIAADVRAPRDAAAERGWLAEGGEGDGRQAFFLELWRWFAELDPAQRANALGQLREATGLPDDPAGPRGLTAAEVAQLAEGGLVAVGAHTVTHPMLPTLSPERQREEIVQSKADAEALVGRPVTAFSYPHGRHDARTARIVREAGFAVVGTSAGRGAPYDCGRATGDPMHVQRVSVRDWDADTFLRKLRGGFEV
jgi:peptidoglycan/xylan/chitin deacetylase (PgdA/CDA1 family)